MSRNFLNIYHASVIELRPGGSGVTKRKTPDWSSPSPPWEEQTHSVVSTVQSAIRAFGKRIWEKARGNFSAGSLWQRQYHRTEESQHVLQMTTLEKSPVPLDQGKQ